MGNLARKTFWSTQNFVPPAGVKYVNAFGVKLPKAVQCDSSAGIFIDAANRGFGMGSNTFGNLGTNNVTSVSSPAAVVGSLLFQTLANYSSNSFGITTGFVLYGWGANAASSPIGDGTSTARSSPVLVVGNLLFQKLVYNGSAYALTPGGALYAWGPNTFGQLGTGNITAVSSPVAVVGGLTFLDVATDTISAIGIAAGGVAYAWGSNSYGNLGTGNITAVSSPTLVVGGLTFGKIVGNTDSTAKTLYMGLTTSGAAYAWGANTDGALGIGNTTFKSSPTAVVGGLSFVNIFAASGGAFYLQTAANQIYAVGLGTLGRLGNGSTSSVSSPVLISGTLNVARFFASGNFNHFITTDGTAYGWGNNVNGQLGLNNTTSPINSPTSLSGSLVFTSIADNTTVNQQSMYGVTTSGALYGWGQNLNGQLGLGNVTSPISSPTLVLGGLSAYNPIANSSKKVQVVAGNTYSVNPVGLNASFGGESLGQGPFDYIVVEYEQ